MVNCCVPNCKNTSSTYGWKKRIDSGERRRKVSFHSVPRDQETRNAWLQILHLNESVLSGATRVCSDHFKEEDFDRRCLIARLLPNAIPKEIKKEDETSISVSSENIVKKEVKLSSNNINADQEEKPPRSATPQDNVSLIADCSTDVTKPSILTADKATMMTHEAIFNSPEKCRLRQRFEYLKKNYKKKIRSLQQNVRRKNNNIATLKHVLNEFKRKKMLTDEH